MLQCANISTFWPRSGGKHFIHRKLWHFWNFSMEFLNFFIHFNSKKRSCTSKAFNNIRSYTFFISTFRLQFYQRQFFAIFCQLHTIDVQEEGEKCMRSFTSYKIELKYMNFLEWLDSLVKVICCDLKLFIVPSVIKSCSGNKFKWAMLL